MTGLPVFLRAYLRRERWMILSFTVGVTLLYWSQAISVDGLYEDQAAFDRAAASMEGNAAFVAMAGPPRALNTTGGQVAWQATAFGAVVVGLMVMFLIGRHTRQEEETGRDELLRSGVVGRRATMTAALLLAVAASLLTGVATSLSLVIYGLPAEGSWIMGIGLAAFGAAFASLALLAAQLTSSTRGAYGVTGALLGVAYATRAIGDVSGNWVSWLSPIGWYQGMHGYSGDSWWPLLLLFALAALASVAAFAVFGRRDYGAGVLAARPGPTRARPWLSKPAGFAWRLQRASLMGWAGGLFLGGLGYGSIGDEVKDLLGDSQFTQDIFTTGGPDLVDSFYAVAALMLVLIASGFTVSSALRPWGEEKGGRVETVLATALARRRWLMGQLTVTVAGGIGVVFAGGLGLGLGYALVTGDAGAIARLTASAFGQAPALLVLTGIAVLCYGAAPRWTLASWLAVAFCFVVMVFGAALQFPQWLIDVSPFSHLAAVPAEPVDWVAVTWLTALGAALVAAGVAAFGRRDLG